jgi:hypothetical protein
MDKEGPASLVGTAAGVYGGLDQTPVCPSSSSRDFAVPSLIITNLILSSIPFQNHIQLSTAADSHLVFTTHN